MKEQLILFETANLAKEKGFDWKCEYCFNSKEKCPVPFRNPLSTLGNKIDGIFSAPTQSELEDWLFEKHSINIEVFFDDAQWSIYVGEFSFPDSSVEFVGAIQCDSFEDAKKVKTLAKEKALFEALELIDN